MYYKYCLYNIEELSDFSEVADFWEKDMKVWDKQSIQNLQQLISLCCSKELEQLRKIEISDMSRLLMHNWYVNAKENINIIK